MASKGARLGRSMAHAAAETAGIVALTFAVLAAFQPVPWLLLPLVVVLVYALLVVGAFLFGVAQLVVKARKREGASGDGQS